MLRSLPFALVLALISGCAAVPAGAPSASPASPKGASKDPEAALTEISNKVDKLTRNQASAQLDLRLETLEAEASRVKAARAVQAAERAVYAARDELASYREVESVKERDGVQLALDRSTNRLESQRADLTGILDIYRDEDEARAKDEIIRRHKTSVDFAERELDQARAQARLVLEFEVPRKIEKLEWALEKAESELAAAERAAERAEMKARLAVERKEAAVLDLEAELEVARAALEKQRAKLGAKE